MATEGLVTRQLEPAPCETGPGPQDGHAPQFVPRRVPTRVFMWKPYETHFTCRAVASSARTVSGSRCRVAQPSPAHPSHT